MDAWLIQLARPFVVLAFAIGFPLWAVLGGQPRMPSEEEVGWAQPTSRQESEVARDAPKGGQSPPYAVTPNGRITSVVPSPAGVAPRGPAMNHEVQPPDRFLVIQRRLEELGASYLLLESLGQPHAAYRFHCELDAPGSDRAGRLFEVTDANPLAAMEKVLLQVEEAHAGRLQLSDRLDRGPRFR